MRIVAIAIFAFGIGAVGTGCRLSYCLDEVDRERDYRLHFGGRTEEATKWGARWVLTNAPAADSCQNIDALGQGESLDVRLLGTVDPGTTRCDGSLMRVTGDPGVPLGELKGAGGGGQPFASARYAVSLPGSCKGEWYLSLYQVDGADPFADPSSDGRPGLIIQREFLATEPGCAPPGAPAQGSCSDHWAGKLERL